MPLKMSFGRTALMSSASWWTGWKSRLTTIHIQAFIATGDPEWGYEMHAGDTTPGGFEGVNVGYGGSTILYN